MNMRTILIKILIWLGWRVLAFMVIMYCYYYMVFQEEIEVVSRFYEDAIVNLTRMSDISAAYPEYLNRIMRILSGQEDNDNE